MEVAEIVITTILGAGIIFTFGEWIYRTASDYMADNLWIEWVIIAVLGMFIFLIWS